MSNSKCFILKLKTMCMVNGNNQNLCVVGLIEVINKIKHKKI